MRGLRGSHNQEERGAIAILVAILLGGGFLLGFLALVADTGTLYLERTVQRGGAEAGSLAVAQRCAENSSECSTSANAIALAGYFANRNAPDGFSAIDTVCGETRTYSGGNFINRLTACASPAQSTCKAVSASYPRFARVVSQSATSPASKLIFPLTRKLNGDSSGIALKMCAQTAWGKAETAVVTLPVALPLQSTIQSDGAPLASELLEFDSNAPYLCGPCSILTMDGQFVANHLPSGLAFANFLFESGSGTCKKSRQVSVANAPILREKNVNNVCGGFAVFQQNMGKEVLIPAISDICTKEGEIFNCTTPNKRVGTWYLKIGGFFKFKLLGVNIVGNPPLGESKPGGWDTRCGSSTPCIYGVFGQGVIPNQKISIDPKIPNLGVQAMELLP